ncbi:MAG: caspase family protein [Deltaproteobacteria bacterium]|nr:caspase family protein [Deltaproteobacteria bacterium]
MALWWLSVSPNVSAQTYDFDEGLETLTKGLVSENRGILKRKKIAVFGIIESKSGKKWEVSSHIEDGIVDALVKNGYRVIERRRIQDVIQKEIKKSTDLWFDQARVAQFGKLVGADFVVTGSYVLWGQGMLKISVRAINVADGEIVAADKVKILTDRIVNLLKAEADEKHLKKAKVSPEKPVKVKRLDEFTHESGKLGKYKALIIGINDYKGSKIPDLETAINDATGMAAVLKEKYGFKVKLLLDREATKEAIYRELRSLTVSTKANDSVLIYFAGHGDLDRTYDGGWWIPADAIGGNPVTYLDNVQVQKAMRSMRARHVLLVSDSCYSGALFGEARSLPPVINDRYYLSLYNEKSRWGMTSGNKTPVSDQGTGGHSVFAYQLIKELGESDKPFLSTHELYAKIAPVIANNSEQTPICRPIVNTGDQGGEFVFVASLKKELPLTIPKVHQITLNKDMLFWESVRDSNDPALYDAYLKTFPDGIFTLIAKRKIETLNQKKRTAATAPVVLKSKLFVEFEPRDAKVRILNIRPKFHQGIALDPGSYRLNVSAPGYMTQNRWIKLSTGEERHVNIQLPRLQKAVETSHSTPKTVPSVSKTTPEVAVPPPVSEPKPETAAAPQTDPAAPVRIFNSFKRAFQSWKDNALSEPYGNDLKAQLKAGARDKLYHFTLSGGLIRGAILHGTRMVKRNAGQPHSVFWPQTVTRRFPASPG